MSNLISDYLIAVFAITYFFSLQKSKIHQFQKSRRWWSFAFLVIGIGALTGGTFHGFEKDLPHFVAQGLWKTTVFTIGFVSCFILVGTALASLPEKFHRWVMIIAAAKLAHYLVWMSSHDDFYFVILDYAPVLVFVLVVQILAYWFRSSLSAPWMVIGVFLSFLAAYFQQLGWSPLRPYFDHNDLYHVIQIIALIFFYKGVLRLQDRKAAV